MIVLIFLISVYNYFKNYIKKRQICFIIKEIDILNKSNKNEFKIKMKIKSKKIYIITSRKSIQIENFNIKTLFYIN